MEKRTKYVALVAGIVVVAAGGYIIYSMYRKDKKGVLPETSGSGVIPENRVVDTAGGGDGFVRESNSGIVRTDYDRTWDYQLRDGVWYTRKKSGGSWISLANNQKATTLLFTKYPKG